MGIGTISLGGSGVGDERLAGRMLEELSREWPVEPFVFFAPNENALAWWREHFPHIEARLVEPLPIGDRVT